jgi:hypothetical protein
MGATLVLMLFMAFNLLTLGALVLASAAWHLWRNGPAGLRTVAIMSGIVLAVIAGAYLLMYALTGYNTVATLFTAIHNEAIQKTTFAYARPYPQTIPSDLQDFALGCGWIGILLLIFWLLRREAQPMVALGLFQIAVVAVSGLLRCETARTWAFLQPLLMLPIGLELATWGRAPRAIAYACLWMITAAIGQNMIFLIR